MLSGLCVYMCVLCMSLLYILPINLIPHQLNQTDNSSIKRKEKKERKNCFYSFFYYLFHWLPFHFPKGKQNWIGKLWSTYKQINALTDHTKKIIFFPCTFWLSTSSLFFSLYTSVIFCNIFYICLYLPVYLWFLPPTYIWMYMNLFNQYLLRKRK